MLRSSLLREIHLARKRLEARVGDYWVADHFL
jgi:hypothetical protein